MNTEIPLLLIRGSLVRAQLREPENEGVARNRDSFFVFGGHNLIHRVNL